MITYIIITGEIGSKHAIFNCLHGYEGVSRSDFTKSFKLTYFSKKEAQDALGSAWMRLKQKHGRAFHDSCCRVHTRMHSFSWDAGRAYILE